MSAWPRWRAQSSPSPSPPATRTREASRSASTGPRRAGRTRAQRGGTGAHRRGARRDRRGAGAAAAVAAPSSATARVTLSNRGDQPLPVTRGEFRAGWGQGSSPRRRRSGSPTPSRRPSSCPPRSPPAHRSSSRSPTPRRTRTRTSRPPTLRQPPLAPGVPGEREERESWMIAGPRGPMASYSVNEAPWRAREQLIDARQYVLDSDWGDVQPGADEQNAFLEVALLGRVRRVAPRPYRGRERRDQGPLRLRLRRLPPHPPHRPDRLRVPRRRVAPQGGRARRPRPAAAARREERAEGSRCRSPGIHDGSAAHAHPHRAGSGALATARTGGQGDPRRHPVRARIDPHTEPSPVLTHSHPRARDAIGPSPPIALLTAFVRGSIRTRSCHRGWRPWRPAPGDRAGVGPTRTSATTRPRAGSTRRTTSSVPSSAHAHRAPTATAIGGCGSLLPHVTCDCPARGSESTRASGREVRGGPGRRAAGGERAGRGRESARDRRPAHGPGHETSSPPKVSTPPSRGCRDAGACRARRHRAGAGDPDLLGQAVTLPACRRSPASAGRAVARKDPNTKTSHCAG